MILFEAKNSTYDREERKEQTPQSHLSLSLSLSSRLLKSLVLLHFVQSL